MPEIKIDIPIEAHQKLKKHAKDDDRSLTKYIRRGLIYLADHPYHISLNQMNSIIDLNNLPENTTIKTKTTKATPRDIPKRDLIKEAYDKEGIFDNRVHRSDDEPFTDKEYQEEIDRTYPYCQNNPDFHTLKKYYDSFTATPEEISEARERFIGLPLYDSLQTHEEPYLYQAFDFIPPDDEPTLDLMTYISRLATGGWYDDDITPHIIIK